MASATIDIRPVLDEPLYEMDNGEKYEVAPMGVFAATIASMLSGWMNAFAAPRQLGFAVTETVFEWDSEKGKLQRRPDVAFIRFDRWQPPSDWQNDPPAFKVVPNLAVEAISPTNTADGVETKIVEYFDAGVELVWVIDPRHQRIYVYESPSQATILLLGDELDGGKVLPGFKVKLSDLFAVPQANPRPPG